MAFYTSVSNLILTTPAVNSIAAITSAAMVHYIDRVEGLINAKLSKRYTIPLSNNIPLLSMIATDLAIYEIVAKRGLTKTSDTENDWPSRFKEANSLLDDIANGNISLATSSGDIISLSTASIPYSNTMDYVPTFGEDDFEQSMQDQDKLDDIADDRD